MCYRVAILSNCARRQQIVTTVSTTTTTTVTAIAAMGLTVAFGAAATMLLILFLSAKELGTANGRDTAVRLAKFTTIGIVPLLLVFTVIAVFQIAGLAG